MQDSGVETHLQTQQKQGLKHPHFFLFIPSVCFFLRGYIVQPTPYIPLSWLSPHLPATSSKQAAQRKISEKRVRTSQIGVSEQYQWVTVGALTSGLPLKQLLYPASWVKCRPVLHTCMEYKVEKSLCHCVTASPQTLSHFPLDQSGYKWPCW